MRTDRRSTLAALTVAFAAAIAPRLARAQPGEGFDPAEARRTVERVAGLLESRYVDPGTGARYAAALRRGLADGRYTALASYPALAERLTADLQAVSRDGHLSVRPPRRPGGADRAQAAVPPPAEIAPGITDARWLDGRVALIAFSHFSDDPAASAVLSRFLVEHRDARALVIDARSHRGGGFAALAMLGDALFPAERPLLAMDVAAGVVAENGPLIPPSPELRAAPGPAGLVRNVHWAVPARAVAPLGTVPVYYLTSHRTYSAAEHLAMALKVTGRAVLIGETTGGGNHFGGTEDVGAGLEMFVPIGRTSDPASNRDWEGVGVSPDVAVPADQALDEALRHISAASRR